MDWLGYVFGAIAIVCLVSPPRLDPAIRWKIWFEARREIERDLTKRQHG